MEITPPVRVHPCGSHMIVYEINKLGVLILRVRHHRENWENDNLICSDQDRQTPPAQPEPLPEHIRSDFCDSRLLFAVAETATQSPGLIEGAIEAGERVASKILSAR